MTPEEQIEPESLILAAEDFDPAEFSRLHIFSPSDERIIRKLIAHGPVLLEGGRGSGKSALMIEATQRLAPATPTAPAFGIYLSLRHLPLIRSEGKEYEEIFCTLLIRRLQELLGENRHNFNPDPDIASVQYGIAKLSIELGKRIVLLFDDAAHIGRETSLSDFFDIFRTLSSSTVSCKATIYPGVTQFGARFDVYNDATVIDLVRDEQKREFVEQFTGVVQRRFPALGKSKFSSPLTLERTAAFLAQSVLGNMRSFVFACGELLESHRGSTIGTAALGSTLIALATNFFWPLLEEVRPKLGKYEPLVGTAQDIAETIFQECGGKNSGRRTALVHRDITSRLSKPFEILEYAGFLSRREASRAMKSGGRGSTYALNLCNLLERVPQARLTIELFERWTTEREEPVEFHTRGTHLFDIESPPLDEDADLSILAQPVESLQKSRAYPYGLTDQKIKVLQEAGIITVGDLAKASDQELLALRYVGEATIRRFRNVVGQAVWM